MASWDAYYYQQQQAQAYSHQFQQAAFIENQRQEAIFQQQQEQQRLINFQQREWLAKQAEDERIREQQEQQRFINFQQRELLAKQAEDERIREEQEAEAERKKQEVTEAQRQATLLRLRQQEDLRWAGSHNIPPPVNPPILQEEQPLPPTDTLVLTAPTCVSPNMADSGLQAHAQQFEPGIPQPSSSHQAAPQHHALQYSDNAQLYHAQNMQQQHQQTDFQSQGQALPDWQPQLQRESSRERSMSISEPEVTGPIKKASPCRGDASAGKPEAPAQSFEEEAQSRLNKMMAAIQPQKWSRSRDRSKETKKAHEAFREPKRLRSNSRGPHATDRKRHRGRSGSDKKRRRSGSKRRRSASKKKKRSSSRRRRSGSRRRRSTARRRRSDSRRRRSPSRRYRSGSHRRRPIGEVGAAFDQREKTYDLATARATSSLVPEIASEPHRKTEGSSTQVGGPGKMHEPFDASRGVTNAVAASKYPHASFESPAAITEVPRQEANHQDWRTDDTVMNHPALVQFAQQHGMTTPQLRQQVAMGMQIPPHLLQLLPPSPPTASSRYSTSSHEPYVGPPGFGYPASGAFNYGVPPPPPSAPPPPPPAHPVHNPGSHQSPPLSLMDRPPGDFSTGSESFSKGDDTYREDSCQGGMPPTLPPTLPPSSLMDQPPGDFSRSNDGRGASSEQVGGTLLKGRVVPPPPRLPGIDQPPAVQSDGAFNRSDDPSKGRETIGSRDGAVFGKDGRLGGDGLGNGGDISGRTDQKLMPPRGNGEGTSRSGAWSSDGWRDDSRGNGGWNSWWQKPHDSQTDLAAPPGQWMPSGADVPKPSCGSATNELVSAPRERSPSPRPLPPPPLHKESMQAPRDADGYGTCQSYQYQKTSGKDLGEDSGYKEQRPSYIHHRQAGPRPPFTAPPTSFHKGLEERTLLGTTTIRPPFAPRQRSPSPRAPLPPPIILSRPGKDKVHAPSYVGVGEEQQASQSQLQQKNSKLLDMPSPTPLKRDPGEKMSGATVVRPPSVPQPPPPPGRDYGGHGTSRSRPSTSDKHASDDKDDEKQHSQQSRHRQNDRQPMPIGSRQSTSAKHAIDDNDDEKHHPQQSRHRQNDRQPMPIGSRQSTSAKHVSDDKDDEKHHLQQSRHWQNDRQPMPIGSRQSTSAKHASDDRDDETQHPQQSRHWQNDRQPASTPPPRPPPPPPPPRPSYKEQTHALKYSDKRDTSGNSQKVSDDPIGDDNDGKKQSPWQSSHWKEGPTPPPTPPPASLTEGPKPPPTPPPAGLREGPKPPSTPPPASMTAHSNKAWHRPASNSWETVGGNDEQEEDKEFVWEETDDWEPDDDENDEEDPEDDWEGEKWQGYTQAEWDEWKKERADKYEVEEEVGDDEDEDKWDGYTQAEWDEWKKEMTTRNPRSQQKGAVNRKRYDKNDDNRDNDKWAKKSSDGKSKESRHAANKNQRSQAKKEDNSENEKTSENTDDEDDEQHSSSAADNSEDEDSVEEGDGWFYTSTLKGKGKGKKGKQGKGKGKDKDGKSKGKKAKRKVKEKNPCWEPAPDKLNGKYWEEHKDKVGLMLVKDMAPKSAKWVYPLLDHSRRSYAGYLPSPMSKKKCQEFFERIRDNTDWLQPAGKNGVKIPRKTAWMVKRGCNCTYTYGQIAVPPAQYPAWMLELMGIVMPCCGLADKDDWPDSCNMNLYADGGMSVGWHADDEALFQGKFRDILIISLSLGVKRKFELRINWPEEHEKAKQVKAFQLGSGDLMTMEGMTQKHMMHRVPKEEDIEGPRINLTWRWVVKHRPKCPASRQR